MSGYLNSIFANTVVERLGERLKKHPKRILFVDGEDPRVIHAARQIAKDALSVPILLGQRSKIKENALKLGVSLENIRIVDPTRSDDWGTYVDWLQQHTNTVNTDHFASFLLQTFAVDCMIVGANATLHTSVTSLLKTIALKNGLNSLSRLTLIEHPEEHNLCFFVECHAEDVPSYIQLSDAAYMSATIAHHLTNVTQRVAFLGADTHNTANERIVLAVKRTLSFNTHFDLHADGDLQADAALDPIIAQQKGVVNAVAGHANILVFPDRTSGSIALKLLQTVGTVNLYGQLLVGLTRPAAVVSRGATAHDIFGTSILTAALAIDRELLFL